MLEMMIAMPLITALFIVFGVLLCWGVKSYVYMKSDYELVEQIRIPVERIERDLQCAEDVKILTGGLYIYCRNASESPHWVHYYLQNADKASRKISREEQPLTGDSRLGDIRITKFVYRIAGNGIVYVEVAGVNLLTNKTYDLHTAVALPGKGGNL